MRAYEFITEIGNPQPGVFAGKSRCKTPGCAGHHAGYTWSKNNPNKPCPRRPTHPSFDNGCRISREPPQTT